MILLRTIALTAAILAFPAFAQKKRIAVFDFDYGTVHGGLSGIFGSDVDIGKGIADMIVDRLVRDGTYSVIERKALEKVLAEQNFSNSDRADASTAARLGRVLGVDAIVIGSITQFGRDDKSKSIGGLGRIGGRYGIGGVGKKESKAVVALSGRIVSTETAEILAVASGKGESTRSGAALLGAGGAPAASAGGAYDMTSSNFANTILGEATGQAVDQMTQQLKDNAGRLPTAKIEISGLIADVSGNTLILNVGSKGGVKVGDKLVVSRVGRTITDPATGKVLRTISEKIGEVTITEVDEGSSVGTYSGAGAPKVGDAIGAS
jgi:curli biogenesis system outer membrane secretion channel CsgG